MGDCHRYFLCLDRHTGLLSRIFVLHNHNRISVRAPRCAMCFLSCASWFLVGNFRVVDSNRASRCAAGGTLPRLPHFGYFHRHASQQPHPAVRDLDKPQQLPLTVIDGEGLGLVNVRSCSGVRSVRSARAFQPSTLTSKKVEDIHFVKLQNFRRASIICDWHFHDTNVHPN